ncbi:TPA: hypothetical protein DEP34_00280 [Candidatus Uhrbacteria bacterium]|nr:hypothetical protein [Candidatus Uhrbacteria bacterium]HCB18810.1 hypothetical protein [Candidatus Uhrbacteria bacterium]
MSFFHKRQTKGAWFAKASFFILLFLVFFLPLCFFPLGVDTLEVHKQTLLVLGVSAAALCWLIAQALGFETKKGKPGLVWPLFFLIAVTGIGAWFSDVPFLSWIGEVKQEYASFLSIISLAVFSYLISVVITDERQWKKVFLSSIFSALLVGVFGFFSLFGFTNVNTVGTAHLFSVYLVTVLTLVLGVWTYRPFKIDFSWWQKAFFIILLLETLATLLIMSYWIVWVILGIGMIGLLAGSFFFSKPFQYTSRFLLPMILIAISVAGCFLSTPLSRFAPLEVTPNTALSFQVAKDTLLAKGWAFGSGPGTFVYDFASFKPVSINETMFWNIRFDSAFSLLLTLLATTGVLGVLAWLGVLCAGYWSSIHSLESRREDRHFILATLGSLTALSFSFLVSGANLTILFVWFLLFGLLFASQKEERKNALSKFRRRFSFVGGIFFALVIATCAGLTIERYAAEAAFAKAIRLDRENAPITDVIVFLNRAATWNRFHDGYYRNISTALLIQSLEEMNRLKQMESVTDLDRERLQAITASAINAATTATDISPANGLNWQVRGQVYRELLSLYANASDAAVTSCLQATQLEPNNPVYWTDLGETYQKAAEVRQQILIGQSLNPTQDALWNQLLVQAESALNTALDRKQDYAPAHYYLSLVYEAQGRLDDAVGKMESVINYNISDVGAYFQLGLLYLERGGEGDLDRAGEAFAQAITLVPGYANAHWFLATVYEQKGLIDYAIMEVEKVLEIDPGNALASARLSRLRSGAAPEEIPEVLEE